jgi:PAS domain S-box-containing protein
MTRPDKLPLGCWRQALLVWVLASRCLFAAEPYQPVCRDPMLESWRWSTFPELSGLGATCMAEAKDGSLWFGTEDALWSYDGFEWTKHPEAAGATISMGFGAEGTLYFASRFEIKQLKAGRWSRILSFDRKAEIRKITLSADGSLWAATSWGLLCRRQSEWTLFTVPEIVNSLRTNQSDPAVRAVLLPQTVLAKARLKDQPNWRYDLNEVYADHQGRIWLGTTGGEILRYDPSGNAAAADQWSIFNESDGLACGRVASILQLQNGEVWVVYESRSGYLNMFDGAGWQKTRLAEAGAIGDCGHLLQTRDGTVWASGRNWLGAFRAGRCQTYQKPEAPIPQANNFVFEAADGGLWIGAPNTEIERVDYGTTRWLSWCDLNFQWESPAGAEWFLHRDGRVVVHEPTGQWISYGVADGLMDAPVLLLGTKAGDLWAAGSHEHTAATARFDGKQWARSIHEDFSWGVDWRAAFESSDGSVWFGAAVDSSGPKNHRDGLLQFRDGHWIAHHQPGRSPPGATETNPAVILPPTPRPESHGKFIFLGESRDGKIWAGRSVLVANDGRRWTLAANESIGNTPVSVAAGIHIGLIESMFTSKEGDLWIGSRWYGAVRYDGHTWSQFQGKDSLVANSVRCLTQTSDGSIWAATDRGVSRFDGRTWTANVLPEALNIPEDDGSLKGTPSGKIWINRLTRAWTIRAWPKGPPIDPSDVEVWTVCHRFQGTPPHTTIVSGLTEVSQPGNISIQWDGGAAWQESQTLPLQFSYRLDGGPWSAYSFEASHSFFTLPSGQHHFEVRARDREFNVDPNPAALDFVVLAPAWQQAWFLALMGVLFGSLLVLAVRVLLERAKWREAHRHLSSLIGSVDGVVWEAEAETFRFTFVSSQAERLLGYAPAQWLKEPSFWSAHMHPDDRARVISECTQRTRELHDHQIEYRFVTADQRTLWLRDIITVLTRNGQASKLRGIMVDITAQKLAEQRIRQLNRTYAVLSDINQLIVRERDSRNILEGVCRIAVQTGGFQLAWVGMVETPGRTQLTVAAHAGADSRMLEELRREGAAGEPCCPPIAEVLRTGGYAVCNKDQHDPAQTHWCRKALQLGFHAFASFALTAGGRTLGTLNLYTADPQFFAPDELALLSEMAADISYALENCERERQRMRAEQQLRASEERFRELADTIDEVFWITTAAFDPVLYVSPAYEKIWGRSCQSLYEDPKSWLNAVHPEDRGKVQQAFEECAARGKFQVEYRIRRPDGELRWIFDHGLPVRNPAGQMERIVGVARDITETRQLGEQLRQSQKLEAIGQLAGGVAHDFNNILSAILMQLDLLAMSDQLTGEERDGMREIRADTERAANLTRQLLLFSRKQLMQARDLDLNDVVAGLAKMLQRIIGEDVRLQLNPHPKPLPIHADPGMLDQVLMNLAVNARDAMPDGGRLTIETTETTVDEAFARMNPQAAPGHYACIIVADTGCGIPADIMPRIFEPFFTTKEPGKGTGLGLATIFGIVQQHRGWLRVESKPGVGTAFRVFLPISAGAGTAGQTASNDKPPGGTETILVAEDEVAVRRNIHLILQRHGYQAICTGTGAEALQAWHENRAAISLLITDMVMPGGMDGQQLALRLRADAPNLKVIFISGYTARLGGKEFQVRSGEHFIQKPFGRNELLKLVRQVLDN